MYLFCTLPTCRYGNGHSEEQLGSFSSQQLVDTMSYCCALTPTPVEQSGMFWKHCINSHHAALEKQFLMPPCRPDSISCLCVIMPVNTTCLGAHSTERNTSTSAHALARTNVTRMSCAGIALKNHRKEYTVATKFGNKFSKGTAMGSGGVDGSPAYIRQAVQESLRRLGTNHIDLSVPSLAPLFPI